MVPGAKPQARLARACVCLEYDWIFDPPIAGLAVVTVCSKSYISTNWLTALFRRAAGATPTPGSH